jgi:DNA-binding MarR family transcriptional regulator
MSDMAATRDLTIKQYRLLAELRYQIRRFLAFRDQTARDNGLEPQQYQALLTIRGAPAGAEVTIGRLAQRMLVRHHSAVEMIDRLVTHGLVTRTRHPEDRRKMLVRLTAKGRRVLRELALSSREELRSSGPALAAVLRRLLSGE